MNQNNHILRILGSAELDSPLDMDKDIQIINATLRIKSIEKRDNSDGTFSYAYKTGIVSAIDLEQSNKKITAKDKTRKSQKLRQAVWREFDNGDEAYPIFMDKLIPNVREVWEFLKDK